MDDESHKTHNPNNTHNPSESSSISKHRRELVGSSVAAESLIMDSTVRRDCQLNREYSLGRELVLQK